MEKNMNIFKYSLLLYLLSFGNIYADIVGESLDEENLKSVMKYSVNNTENIFLYKYSYSISPHAMTVLIAKSCDCERSLQLI